MLGPLVQPWGLVAAGVPTIVDAKLDRRRRARWPSSSSACCPPAPTWPPRSTPGCGRTQTQDLLDRLRAWITTHTDQAIVVISGVVGAWLIADSVYLLVT